MLLEAALGAVKVSSGARDCCRHLPEHPDALRHLRPLLVLEQPAPELTKKDLEHYKNDQRNTLKHDMQRETNSWLQPINDRETRTVHFRTKLERRTRPRSMAKTKNLPDCSRGTPGRLAATFPPRHGNGSPPPPGRAPLTCTSPVISFIHWNKVRSKKAKQVPSVGPVSRAFKK